MEPYSVEQLTKDLTDVAELYRVALERLSKALSAAVRHQTALEHIRRMDGGGK